RRAVRSVRPAGGLVGTERVLARSVTGTHRTRPTRGPRDRRTALARARPAGAGRVSRAGAGGGAPDRQPRHRPRPPARRPEVRDPPIRLLLISNLHGVSPERPRGGSARAGCTIAFVRPASPDPTRPEPSEAE